jgi:hypothetical protein
LRFRNRGSVRLQDMLFGVLKRHRAWGTSGPEPQQLEALPPKKRRTISRSSGHLLLIRLSVSSDVKTTLQSDVQLDEMLAAEPYKSVRK